MKVWVVCEFDWEDHSPLFVCASLELAKAHGADWRVFPDEVWHGTMVGDPSRDIRIQEFDVEGEAQ